MSMDSNNGGGSRNRKGGAARLFKVFMTESLHFLGAGFLAAAGAVPFAVCLLFAIGSHAILPLAIGGVVGGMIAAPQLVCLADTILRAMREDSSDWWTTYRRAWKQDVKGSLLPGALIGLVFGLQLFIFAQLDRVPSDTFQRVVMIIGSAITFAIVTWHLPQLALMDLPIHRALLNAVLLTMRRPLHTLGAVLIQMLYWACVLITFPYSLAILVILNFWLPMLIAMMFIYDSLDETFHVEESIKAMEKEQGHSKEE